MVQNKRSRLILDMTYVTYLGTERINGTVRVLFKTRLIFSSINGPIMLLTSSENPFGVSNTLQIKVSLDIASVLTIFTLPYINVSRRPNVQYLFKFRQLFKEVSFCGKFFII